MDTKMIPSTGTELRTFISRRPIRLGSLHSLGYGRVPEAMRGDFDGGLLAEAPLPGS